MSAGTGTQQGSKRDKRTDVNLSAQLRTNGSWDEVRIMNVSARGLVMTTGHELDPGEYVEIRRGPEITIVARVVWRNGRSVGLRTQDRIDVEALLKPPVTRQAPAARAEENRNLGSMIQYCILLAVVVSGAVALTSMVYYSMKAPMEQVENALGPE